MAFITEEKTQRQLKELLDDWNEKAKVVAAKRAALRLAESESREASMAHAAAKNLYLKVIRQLQGLEDDDTNA